MGGCIFKRKLPFVVISGGMSRKEEGGGVKEGGREKEK